MGVIGVVTTTVAVPFLPVSIVEVATTVKLELVSFLLTVKRPPELMEVPEVPPVTAHVTV